MMKLGPTQYIAEVYVSYALPAAERRQITSELRDLVKAKNLKMSARFSQTDRGRKLAEAHQQKLIEIAKQHPRWGEEVANYKGTMVPVIVAHIGEGMMASF